MKLKKYILFRNNLNIQLRTNLHTHDIMSLILEFYFIIDKTC